MPRETIRLTIDTSSDLYKAAKEYIELANAISQEPYDWTIKGVIETMALIRLEQRNAEMKAHYLIEEDKQL